MTMLRRSAWTAQQDAISQAASPGRVQETSHSNDELNISRDLEPPVGESTQDKAAETESDSCDSLFITQKPVPKAERSRRWRPRSQRSRLTSRRDPQEDNNDSTSASDGESETAKRARCKRKKPTLPKYTFPFLAGKSSRGPHPSSRENASLHNYGMGGFFKCVRDLWESYQNGDDLQLSLPTVDMDGENISPLSENEEEWPGSEDIRVVEKKCFLAPSKAKGPHPWCPVEKGEWSINQKSDNKHERKMSQGRQRNIQNKIPAMASTSRQKVVCSDVESLDEGGTSHRLLDDRGTDDTSIQSPSAMPETKRSLPRGKRKHSQRKEREEEVCDVSDATVCEQLHERETLSHDDVMAREEERDSPDSTLVKKKRDAVGQEEAPEVRAEEDAVMSHTCNVVDGSKEKKKTKKRKQSVEDDGEQLQPSAVTETPNDVEIQRKKKQKKKENTIPIAEDDGQKEALDMTSDLSPISEGRMEELGQCLEKGESSQEGLAVSYIKKKKKHKKKRQSAQDDNAGADDGGELRKKRKETVDNAELMCEKKSQKDVEDAAPQNDGFVSEQEKKKRKTSSFPVADAEENDAQTHEEPRSPFSKQVAGPVSGAERPGVSAGADETDAAEMGGNLEASKHVVRKKKRKRKISAAQESEQKDARSDSELPEATDKEVKKKKKKKRKRTETESGTAEERLERTHSGGCSQTDEIFADTAESEVSLNISTAHKTSKQTPKLVKQASPSAKRHGSAIIKNRSQTKKVESTVDGVPEWEVTECAGRDTQKPRVKAKKKGNRSPVLSDTSQFHVPSTDRIVKNKQRKTKKSLLNPNDVFLSDVLSNVHKTNTQNISCR